MSLPFAAMVVVMIALAAVYPGTNADPAFGLDEVFKRSSHVSDLAGQLTATPEQVVRVVRAVK